MTQGVLVSEPAESLAPIWGAGRQSRSDNAMVVALDRQGDEQAIVLRFLMGDQGWGAPAKQVKLSEGLAEQLMQLLADELDRSKLAL
jgi:hypothetical protein